MTFGCRSNSTPLQRVQLIPPAKWSQKALDDAGWGPMSAREINRQFKSYVKLLENRGISVDLAEAASNPDAIYAYDNCMVTPKGAILFRSKKPNRQMEIYQCRNDLQRIGIPILAELDQPDQIDGGDVFWLDRETLAVGLSWRTNTDAVESLSAIMNSMNVRTIAFDIPNVGGPDVCMHLMSLISPLRADLAIVAEELAPVRLIQELDRRNIDIIPCPLSEFDSLGCNVLALGNSEVISLAGNWQCAQQMRDAGLVVHEFHGPDLCLAGNGGPTCLTRVITRDASL